MDPERQAKVDQLNLQNGAKTVNEVRAEHDMPAVKDGDEPLASANLMTLKALIAKSDASTQLKPERRRARPQAERKKTVTTTSNLIRDNTVNDQKTKIEAYDTQPFDKEEIDALWSEIQQQKETKRERSIMRRAVNPGR